MTSASLESQSASSHNAEEAQLVAGKRRRRVREALTGYIFVLPAAIATFVFGLWPVIAGFYESLKSGSPVTNKYVGLDNYTRSVGSLIYIIIFALCLIFIYAAYGSWRRMMLDWRESGVNPWHYVVPGLISGAGLISLSFLLVTGADGYMWFPLILLLTGLAGYFAADQMQKPPDARNPRALAEVVILLVIICLTWIGGFALVEEADLGGTGNTIVYAVLVGLLIVTVPRLGRIRTGSTVTTSLMMGLLMLLSILLGMYGINQLQDEVTEAQDIAANIFNQEVLNATVIVSDDDTLISGLSLPEDVIVTVEVAGESIQAPLAADAYSEIPAEDIATLETEFSANQRVQVVLPDGSIAEGTLTDIPSGQRLTVEFEADDPVAIRETDIYSALDVGEGVVRRDGFTQPLMQQLYATLLIFVGIATMFTMTVVRRKVDDDYQPRLHRWLHIGRVLIGLAVIVAFFYMIAAVQLSRQAAAGMGALTEEQFDWAYEFAFNERPHPTLRAEVLQAQLLYWPQVFLVAVGAFLIGAAYLVWQSAQRRETKTGFSMTILLAILMMVGGWLLLSELPRSLALAGREAEEAVDALTRTALYSVGTVPVQLTLGLFLAYLLFSEIKWGKSLYRVVYFMPYIAPSVATSTVFLVIFSLNQNSLANQALGLFGIDALTWLKDPNGIVRVVYEIAGGNPLHIPEALAGPSLALTTVILYNIWVFAGYNAVVFLAGLGAIPSELYEAAEVDGANRWARFRNITLPLLSPTTFFLSMLSIIGTFKAFSHIYVLRGQATGKEIDTMSVHIFNTLYAANDPGYAAALAFALFGVILILTLVQNRLAREQVFYG